MAIRSQRRFEGDLVFDCHLGLRHRGPGGDETDPEPPGQLLTLLPSDASG